MVKVGQVNELEIIKETDIGAYLDGDSLGQIFMPFRYVPPGKKTGDHVEAFIYFDSEDRIIATTDKPKAMVGDFACLKVVAVNSVGAFLDWGLPKDLLVPYNEQKQTMVEGQSYVVAVFYDKNTNRIAASAKLNKFLDQEMGRYHNGLEVDLLICDHSDIGYNAVINNQHWGVLFDSEVYRPLKYGQKIKGYIKRIRDDGKIDLCLQQPGYKKVSTLSDRVMEELKKQGGYLPLSDKSAPEAIYKAFGASKKAYKMAIGALYKNRQITIEKEGITLIKENG
ncbi:S1 RNA-binding domain-containing protein [Alkalimarinus coralli]|uniref:CvfB family protein n=1 Tax=Alkalimarinus coralli TaxID=2935863 RepID=UPI00202AEA8D|nr:S1-like domain-containing RNA-binding protein [Alkalimarinus coralli]